MGDWRDDPTSGWHDRDADLPHAAPDGAAMIAAERCRQIKAEGWTPEHDDEHTDGSLAMAAVCYAATEPVYVARRNVRGEYGPRTTYVDPWPESWCDSWDKRPGPKPTREERIRALAKAGALIAAEIDRLHRASKEGA